MLTKKVSVRDKINEIINKHPLVAMYVIGVVIMHACMYLYKVGIHV